MAEILASIRRIIAEDASGPKTPPSPPRVGASLTAGQGGAAKPQPQRGFMSRDAFLHSSQPAESEPAERYFKPVNPANPEPAPEPAAKSGAEQSVRPTQDAKAEPGRPKAADAETSSASAKPESKPAPSDTAKKADAKIATAAEEKRAAVPARIEPQSDTAGIEAQLTELLDNDLRAMREAQNGHARRLTDIEDAEATPVTEPSPQNSASRTNANGAQSHATEANDPFAFDLGPSPFQSRSRPDKAGDPQSSEQRPAEPRTGEQRSSPQSPAPAAHQPINRAETANGHARHGMNGVAPAPASPFVQPAAPARHEAPRTEHFPAAPAPRPSAPFAVPSVSATLGPHRTLEPLSASFRPAPSDPAYESNGARQSAFASDANRLDAMLQPASSEGAGFERVMEDAVADLLRPLLKTWLAENMPRIVERALRREVSERLLPGQKNSRD
jgi:cell pole-organizing protein PopZ